MKFYQSIFHSVVYFVSLVILSISLGSCGGNSDSNTRIEVPYTEAVNGVYFLADKDVNQTLEIYVTEPDNIEPRKISILPDLPYQLTVTNYKVSPDKKWVAYRVWGGGEGSLLYIIPTIGGEPIYLAGDILPEFTKPDYFISEFKWSPDSKYLAYSVSSYINGGQLYTVSMLDLTKNHLSQKVPTSIVSISAGVNNFSWSPDGTYLAYRGSYRAIGRKLEIFIIAPDGSNYKKISKDFESEYAIGVMGHEWSPNSNQLSLMAAYSDDPQQHEIYIVTVANNTHIQITNKNIQGVIGTNSYLGEQDWYSRFLQWSHDGQYIAYSALTNNIAVNLYVATPDGLINKNITNIPISSNFTGVEQYAWSPTTNTLAYTSNENEYNPNGTDKYQLYTVSYDGSDKTIVSGSIIDGGFVSSFRWSPDGIQLAYVASMDTVSRFELYTVYPDGLNQVKVSGIPITNFGDVSWYIWSPNSNNLAFTSNIFDLQRTEVYTVNRDATALTQISGPMPLNHHANYFYWSQDSSHIAYTANQEYENIWHAYRAPYNSNANQRISGSIHNGRVVIDLVVKE
jgi:dipeptidyl aminopeptidase/acylaminoacyl peptidase